MEHIGLYTQTTAFSNDHAGTAEWSQAKRDGKRYFIKKFHSPLYPAEDIGLPEEKRQRRIKKFHETQADIKAMCAALSQDNTSGLLVVPLEVIIYQYHICTVAEYMEGNVPPQQVCLLSAWQRIVLMRTLTMALINVHQAGVIQSDMKPDNVLITQDPKTHSCVLKLIDFDGSYMAASPPKEVTGNPAFFAPEVFLQEASPDLRLTQKIDVFALGIVLHYFWTGKLPQTHTTDTIGQHIAKGQPIFLDSSLPQGLKNIVLQALISCALQAPRRL